MVDQWEAMMIAAPLLTRVGRPGPAPGIGVAEFDLGFVLWRLPPPQERGREVGAGRVVVDRRSGEPTFWPSVSVEMVMEDYREYRAGALVPPLTWDPLVRARHDRLRAPFPDRVAHLVLAEGSARFARSMKGDGTPNLHRLVAEALDLVPVAERVRSGDRCAEVAALSDLLHAEDTRRGAAGRPLLTMDLVRDDLVPGAGIECHEVWDWAEPAGGHAIPPCRSCQCVLRRFGFGPDQPAEASP